MKNLNFPLPTNSHVKKPKQNTKFVDLHVVIKKNSNYILKSEFHCVKI